MTRFDAVKRKRKRGVRRNTLFNLGNLISSVSSERKRIIKKTGRKVIKYLEVTKWVTLNNSQKE
jgi:hypothetical protein